jgi:phosphoribosyl 1,2-cyclic phosphodiesterase
VLRFRSLASSSAGNATLVEATDGTTRTRVLIDCGLGLRQLETRLEQAAVAADGLAAVFITHEHGDHVGCVMSFAARHRIPIWTSAGTREEIKSDERDVNFHEATDGVPLAVGALQIRPFTVPHDAREPLQLTCTDGDRVLGIATDLGHVTPHILDALTGCQALLLESNHDPDLLARSAYPEFLKSRVGGELGHLNNGQAAAALRRVRSTRLGIVVGGHLSERNNRPDLVRASFAAALDRMPDDILVSSRHGLDWLPV